MPSLVVAVLLGILLGSVLCVCGWTYGASLVEHSVKNIQMDNGTLELHYLFANDPSNLNHRGDVLLLHGN